MALKIHAGFDDLNAFAFEELLLKRGVWFADEEFAAFAENAMPRNAFSGRSGGHGSACAARAAW
jgi:hypothetical protein